jgi:hypothetical protein
MDGAADQDDTDQDDDAGQDEQDTDDPAELKKRLARAAAALKKANGEAAKLRRTVKKAPAKKAAPAARDEDGTPAVVGAVEALEARYRSQAIRREGAAAILEAGFSGSRQEAKDLTRLFDLDELDVDEDGDVDGLDDAVEMLKERYPALFVTKQAGAGRQQRHRVPGIDASAGRTGAGRSRDKATSSAERIGMALRGGR